MCVSIPAPRILLYITGVIWALYDWLNKFCCFAIDTIDGRVVPRNSITDLLCVVIEFFFNRVD